MPSPIGGIISQDRLLASRGNLDMRHLVANGFNLHTSQWKQRLAFHVGVHGIYHQVPTLSQGPFACAHVVDVLTT